MKLLKTPRIDGSHIATIKRLLKNPNHHELIDQCFAWFATEQGFDYWREFYDAGKELSSQDKLYLKLLTGLGGECKVWISPDAEKLLLK